MKKIQDYLKENILVFDGSMGTYFASKYKNLFERCELVNVSDPEKIYAIHREYIEAGCHAIKTNTFAANSESIDDEKKLKEVLKKGFEIAEGAAKDKNVYVFADIGYIQVSQGGDVAEQYKKNVDIFLECKATYFLFETLANDNGIYEIADYIKGKCPEAFIIVSFAIQPDGYTKEGAFGNELIANAIACKEVDAVGMNCVSGPHHMYEYLKNIHSNGKWLSVMPNAGYPTIISNRTFFQSSPDYYAGKMKQIVAKGATIIGGCCGTTPEYIEKTIEALNGHTEAKDEEKVTAPVSKQAEIYLPEFNRKLERGEKVIAVELDPPEGADIKKFLSNTMLLKNAGIDLMTIADCPIARPRVDSSLLAAKIKREYDVDVMPHMTCRDRNVNATKALLLGLNIEKIRNVLLVTGDPIPSAQRDEVKSVYNFNSRILAKYVTTLNQTVFLDNFHIFAALNVNALNFEVQLRLAREKEENGVVGFLTQPVMTKEGLENLKQAKWELNGKILAGIIPIMNYRNACFMESEISGIRVAPEIIDLFKDKSKEEGAEIGVKVAARIVEEVKDYCDGYYLMTPFSRADIICQIIEKIKAVEG